MQVERESTTTVRVGYDGLTIDMLRHAHTLLRVGAPVESAVKIYRDDKACEYVFVVEVSRV